MNSDSYNEVGQENLNIKLNKTLKLVDDLAASRLRRLRAEAYDCAAKCCLNSSATREEVDQCVSKCHMPIDKAQEFVSSELDRFQYRLQLCLSQCTLELKDKLCDNPSAEEINVYNQLFQSCMSSCVDTVLMHVPDMIKRIKAKLPPK